MLFQIYIINITTLVLSFFTIGGLGIWKLEDDIYIYLYPHSYNFLWTLVIFNIFFSISVIGMTIHNKSRTYIELKLYELEKLVYIIFAPITLIIGICWLAISSNITQITDECFRFRKIMENEHFFHKFTCTGEVMISIFGFTLFIIYGSLFIFNIVEIIKMLIENYRYNQNTENEINEPMQSPQELLTRNSSLQQYTTIV